MNRRGLAPAIATLVLLATTVVVALAVAIFAGSLSFTFIHVEELSATELKITGQILEITLANKGTEPTTLQNIQIGNHQGIVTVPPLPLVIDPGSSTLTILLQEPIESATKIELNIHTARARHPFIGVGQTYVRQSGYLGEYYNQPNTHPDMEQSGTGRLQGLVSSVLPLVLTESGVSLYRQFDWWDEQYFSFRRIDQALTFTSNFYPLHGGLPGDPNDFAVHWRAIVKVAASGVYAFTAGSDDDSWVFVDGRLAFDNGGIHSYSSLQGSVELSQGSHLIDVYFAERKKTQSAFAFAFSTPGVDVYMTC